MSGLYVAPNGAEILLWIRNYKHAAPLGHNTPFCFA